VNQQKLVLIKIGAGWCGPCKSIAPKFAAMAQQYNPTGKCILVDLDIDEVPMQDVNAVPHFKFFYGGKIVHTEASGDIVAVEQKLRELLTNGCPPQGPQNGPRGGPQHPYPGPQNGPRGGPQHPHPGPQNGPRGNPPGVRYQ
jgi:thiol-disulfide isomerase/thioredoxin